MRNSPSPFRLFPIVAVAILVLSAGCGAPRHDAPEPEDPGSQSAIVPEPIPPGFDYPANRAQLQAEVDANNVAAMREHAWNLWAGLTSPSASTYDGHVLPIWETWLATEDVFQDPPVEGQSSNTLDAPARLITTPSQFAHIPDRTAGDTPEEDERIVAFNKFDPNMVDYLWAAHSAPKAPSEEFFYTSAKSLLALNQTWGDTAIIDRKVTDAPPPSIELKPVLMWVRQTGLTALPLWQGPNASTAPECQDVSIDELRHPHPGSPPTNCHPAPSTWTHCVLIDPLASTSSLTPATQEQFAAADRSQTPSCTDVSNAQYAGLNMLYSFVLDAQQAADFNKVQGGGGATAGDHAVFMAMHVNTKEIVNWTWQTFWWQGGGDPPQNYPGSRVGMTSNVTAPWSNYAMCTAYSQTTGPGDTGDMRVCFNPFLETSKGIPDGLRSNCTTCHGTARIPQAGSNFYPPSYSVPVSFGDPSYFAGTTKTDFSWAMPLNPKDKGTDSGE